MSEKKGYEFTCSCDVCKRLPENRRAKISMFKFANGKYEMLISEPEALVHGKASIVGTKLDFLKVLKEPTEYHCDVCDKLVDYAWEMDEHCEDKDGSN
jgi:hypothetical protein